MKEAHRATVDIMAEGRKTIKKIMITIQRVDLDQQWKNDLISTPLGRLKELKITRFPLRCCKEIWWSTAAQHCKIYHRKNNNILIFLLFFQECLISAYRFGKNLVCPFIVDHLKWKICLSASSVETPPISDSTGHCSYSHNSET